MNKTEPFGGDIVWTPSFDYVNNAHLTHFMQHEGIANFNELMRRSTEDVTWFTEAILWDRVPH